MENTVCSFHMQLRLWQEQGNTEIWQLHISMKMVVTNCMLNSIQHHGTLSESVRATHCWQKTDSWNE
jgi:hypothetical protein